MAGRKNKYHTNIEPNIELIVGYLNGGHTETSVAERFGVGKSTWLRYKKEHKEFREAIRLAGMHATAAVVNSLYKRAKGYQYEEITTEIVDGGPQRSGPQQGQPAIQRRVIKKVTKEVPPDTAAAIFWTINRDPDHWQNSQHIKHSGEIANTGVLQIAPPMEKEEWLRFYKQNVENKQKEESKKET